MHNYTSMSSWMVVASAIILIGVTYLAPRQQPTTQRPFSAELTSARPISPEKVRARLWQDPLEVGWKRIGTPASGEKRSGESGIERLWKEWRQAPLILQSLIDEESYEHLFFLPIVLSGKPYPETREQRLRSRFALQEAMETMGFRPSNYDYLYYFPAPLSSGIKGYTNEIFCPICIEPEGPQCCEPQEDKISGWDTYPRSLQKEDFVPVTYEIFEYIGKNENQTIRKVLVFWIDNRIVDRGEIPNYRNVEKLATYMAPEIPKRSRLSVLTLSGSDELLALIRGGAASPLPKNKTMQVNYVVSTAPKSQFLRRLKKEGKIHETIEKKIARSMPSDNYVLAAIVDELQRRIPQFGIPRNGDEKTNKKGGERGNVDEVWLLSEQDTFYSQVMKDEFKEITSRRKLDVKVRSIGFLKGIDGNLPNDLGTAKEEHARRIDNLTDLMEFLNQSGAPQQRLFDRRQIDYLQRLAEKLLQEERKKPFQQRVKAIGILGGDVYDKMLVLDVFRNYFPATHYFTTDLDSVYLYGPKAKTARNLIIGSAFGLSPTRLVDEKEGQVVFRDSYQTALYHSILKLLWPAEEKEEFERAFEANFRIGLFEVGRSNFYRLVDVENDVQGRYSWHYPASLGEESIPGALGEDATKRKESLRAPFTTEFIDNEKPLSILERWGRWLLLVLVTLFAAIILIMAWIFVRYSQEHKLFSEEFEPSSPHLIWHVVRRALQVRFSWISIQSSSFFSWGIGIFVIVFLIVLLIVAPSYLNGPRGDLEPMYWVEGISAWPSIFLRLAIFLVGVAMLASSLAGNAIAINRLKEKLRVQDRKILHTHPDADTRYAETRLKGPLTRDLIAIFFLTAISMGFMSRIMLVSQGYSDGFFTPGRGHWVFLAHEISIALSLSMLLVLVWWAAFRHRRSRMFLEVLGEELQDARKSGGAGCSSRPNDVASLSAAEVNALEDYAGVSSVTLLPPFAMMVLLVVSRHTIFDGWNIPLVLIIFLSFLLFILLVSAFQLSSAARRLKLAELKFHKIRAEPDERKREIAATASVWEDAAGPFGNYQQQPIIQALLFVAAGFGISFIEPMFQLFGM